MAKKKAAPTLSATLAFRKEWIFDPGPDVLGISKAAQIKLNQLKTDFTKNANEVIKQGQQ